MIRSKSINSIDEYIDANDLSLLQSSLNAWGRENYRDYPWRITRNPYGILISEVMLHRTRSEQVVPIYLNFMRAFPDIRSLGNANENVIHEVMRPLGLKWRIDLVHPMAIFIIEHFHGEIPQAKADLKMLPGVSEYIAGAVRCFAWDMHEAITDTNTVRITGRIFGLTIRDSSRRSRIFKELLLALVPRNGSREFNYALLDLGAKLCTKRTEPLCELCPIRQFCQFGLTKASVDESA